MNDSQWTLKLQSLNQGSCKLTGFSADKKKSLLIELGHKIKSNESKILSANHKDISELPDNTSAAFRDRLMLNSSRIQSMVDSLNQIAIAKDPVGEEVEKKMSKWLQK
jgi:gamma-glutamyl phosphate reductase